jgi:hypothetical protein
MRDICTEWHVACQGSEWSDHGHLLNVLCEHRDELSVYYLPMQYAKMVPLKRKGDSFQVIKHSSGYSKIVRGEWQI